MTSQDVWVTKDDGSDIVRVAAITAVGRDYNGTITVRLAEGEHATVTLVATDAGHDRDHPPSDFHRQLLRVIAQLADTAEPAIVRPAYEPDDGWHWVIERL
jgi:hypothetical protein